MSIHLYGRLLLIISVSFATLPVCAQEDVEINLEVLEGYDPPPMFSSPEPEPQPPLKAPPVKKKQAQPKTESKKPKAAKVADRPPVPPRRPKVTHAAESFIAKARAEYLASKDDAESEAPQEASQIAVVPVKKASSPPPMPGGMTIKGDDDLEMELMSPTVQEILASIDDGDDDKRAPVPAGAVTALPSEGANISFGFEPGVSGLPLESKQSILTQVRSQLTAGNVERVEIRAYASMIDQVVSSARRISLARALEIRDFLTQGKVDASDIDIRPMGVQPGVEPPDRVDIVFITTGK